MKPTLRCRRLSASDHFVLVALCALTALAMPQSGAQADPGNVVGRGP